jgi:hypothetical protein
MSGQTDHRVVRREGDVAKIASPLILAIHNYWLGKRGAQSLPSWSDIDPSEMSAWLPNLIVAGIEHDPVRVFYRLAGTRIVEFRGEITGHYLEQISWSSAAGQAMAREAFAQVVATRVPLFSEVDIFTRGGARHRIFTGVWPLAPAPEAPIDRCLAAEDYGDLDFSTLR